MLSYQHIYHAGNFADVQKHLLLIRTLQKLKKENKPITWLDTHAGRGVYDLSAPEAKRLEEYKDGFLKYRMEKNNRRDLIQEEQIYLDIVKQTSSRRKIYYPGSALIAAKLLGKNDHITACELHKGEVEHLKAALGDYSYAKALKEDGYNLLNIIAKSNPFGGVLIDPSYEVKAEYEQVFESVRNALLSWTNGIFLIWYPLLPAEHHLAMLENFKQLKSAKINVDINEITIRDKNDGQRGLYGSGMIVIYAG